MQLEKIRRINKSKIIVGGVITLGVIGAISILPSFAKYRLTESINIANGVVNYKVPDFQIVAMYKSDDGKNYTEIEGRMPESGYTINEEKSYCNLITGGEDTEAVLKTVDGNHIISNIIKGDKCTIYFDKKLPSNVEELIASLEINTSTPDFSKTATTDEGVYKVNDGMYGGNSYYYRGAVENNYVMFADLCWRIIRINGDGSIRLIYDGAICHTNGAAGEVAVTNQMYNASCDRSEYVGYTYASGSQRPSDNATGTASNLKTQTEDWYDTNITKKGFDGKVVTGKFCNDRNTSSGTWSSQSNLTFYYTAYSRLFNSKKPTLSCSTSTEKNDIYNLKAGAITADEVVFAGGGVANKSYYLYNGQYYWTMTPYYWYVNASDRRARVFGVFNGGLLTYADVNSTKSGIRPVINLKADITFSSGDGTVNAPYEAK